MSRASPAGEKKARERIGRGHPEKKQKEEEAAFGRILTNFLLEKRKFDKENQYGAVGLGAFVAPSATDGSMSARLSKSK